MTTHTLYRSSRSLLLLFMIFLGACTGTQVAPPVEQVSREPVSAEDWLQLAQGAPADEQVLYRLKAAQIYQREGQVDAAAKIAQSLPGEQLPATAIGDYLALSASLVEAQSGSLQAIQWFNDPRQQALLQRATPEQQAGALGMLADLQDRAGQHSLAIATRIRVNALLRDGGALADNQDAIWLSLLQTPPGVLRERLDAKPAPTDELRGWYALALLTNTLEGDIDQQVEQLDRWRQRYPGHPAAITPPAEVELARHLATSKPKQIAVLLPMQGQLQNAGYAIRDGILKAYFDARARGASSSRLEFYDTVSNPDMAALYRRAVDNGAELIIGPLTKNHVEAMLRATDGLVPVLALNYAADGLETGDNFYQYGLSTLDEAAQAAASAWHKGYQRAFVIHGTDSQSSRGAEAFNEAWLELGGNTVEVVEFDTERSLSESIKRGLHVDLSQQRARTLESITATSLQYNPRRRQDIDFVYLPVATQQARSIKPLLAFHFAQDLPVYASSRIYRGKPDPRGDADLNGVRFTDTPWTLGSSAGQQTVDDYIDRGGSPSKNLYAMGIDAFQLAPRIPQILYTPGLRFRGNTGTLTLSAQGVVVRQPSWAVFRGGIATMLEEEDESMDAITSKKQAAATGQDNGPAI